MDGHGSREPEGHVGELSGGASSGRRAQWLYGVALFLIYLLGVLPRLPVAGFDEPDLTYGDEQMTLGQAERLLREPGGKILHFHKAPGVPHFLFLAFKPYYTLAKGYFGWQSPDDVQWWRVRHYWRSLNILVGGLTIVLAGLIGARAFNRRVGLLTAALCAVSSMCSVWFTFMKEEGLLTLSTTFVVYAACRYLARDSRRWVWVGLAGLGTGSALAFKYNAAPVALFFVLVLFLSNEREEGAGRGANWFSRVRLLEIAGYGLSSAATLLAWFPQLVSRTNDVWVSLTSQPQIQALNVAQIKMPSVGRLLSTAWATWKESFWRGEGLSDTWPLYFFILITAVVIVTPVVALVRRRRFLLALSAFVWLMYLAVCYQWLFSGWRFRHYFLPAIVPIYLLTASGLDGAGEAIAARMVRRSGRGRAIFASLFLILIGAWPLWVGFGASQKRLAYIRSSVGGAEQSRALRRSIIRGVPAGARTFVPMLWVKPYISDSFLDNRPYWSWRVNEWGEYHLDDLVRRGFDFVCAEIYPLPRNVERPMYLKDLGERKVKPTFMLPRVSHLYGLIHYIPVQPPEGASFNLGLYFREPRAGDHAGVRGEIPPDPFGGDDKTTRNLTLKIRLYNGEKWWPKFIRWEVLLDGKTLWHGRDTTDTSQVALSLPIRARPGAEILIRTVRTDFQQEATWGFGLTPSQLKVDGLEVVAADSGQPVAVRWRYTGLNGGPCAPYGMRSDWLHNEAPPPLLDMGFDGEQPLVEAWRPYQVIEPRDRAQFPEEKRCRQMAQIERTVGAGLNGSNALRFRVGYPAKGSAKLGIMQPIAYPDSQRVRKVRIHYRLDGEAENHGETTLRLAATGFSVSGVYIDRAEVAFALPSGSTEWHTAALNVAERWQSRHARTDLVDFLEITIETLSGPGAVLNCLMDEVGLE